MNLIKATDRDNDRLLHYFAQMPYEGAIELRTRRMFNFFNQYRIQSEDYVTYLLQNDERQIEAMASLIFRNARIGQQTETIGYATDLRVSPTRRAILTWSKHFLPVLEAARASRECRYIFSVVAHSQKQAYNAFIRPRNVKRQMPRYHLFRRFEIVTLHGLWPFHDLPLKGIKVRSANIDDVEQVANYIIKKTEKRPLRFIENVDDFRRSLERWHDLPIENFLLAFNKNGDLIGCTAPWTSQRVQRLTPVKYSQKAENLADVLKVLSYVCDTHTMPALGSELQFRHLTHLHADNPDIFYSLLFHAFQQAGKKEFLMYPHFEGEPLTLPPKSFISAETPYGLYCILSPNDPIPDFLKPGAYESPPVFEPAFI